MGDTLYCPSADLDKGIVRGGGNGHLLRALTQSCNFISALTDLSSLYLLPPANCFFSPSRFPLPLFPSLQP